MVPRLIKVLCLITATSLSACASPMGLEPLVGSAGFCEMMKPHYPIMLSRSDSGGTKKQVAQLNDLYAQQCMPKPQN
jgi:hypothetical protein